MANTNEVKFMHNGIKVNGKLYRAWYSIGNCRKLAESTISIYAKDYEGFPEIDGLTIKNDTDSMTDYFEKDRIRVTIDNPFYQSVYNALKLHEEKVEIKRNKKRAN